MTTSSSFIAVLFHLLHISGPHLSGHVKGYKVNSRGRWTFHPGRFPPCFLYTRTFPPYVWRGLPPRVWRRRRHAGAARLRYRRGGDRQATDVASDLLQRLTTTTAAAAPLFGASRCIRCRRCSRYPPGTCMSPLSTQILQRQLHTICLARRNG